MNLLINVLVAVVIFWLIYAYLLPLMPEPIRTVALVIFILAVVVYLLRFLP